MSNFLFKNKHYAVGTGNIPYGEAIGQPCYVITNLETGVDEGFSYVLPEAIMMSNRYSESLTRALAGQDDDWDAFDDLGDMPPVN